MAARLVKASPKMEARAATLDLLYLASMIRPPSSINDAIVRRGELSAYEKQLKQFRKTAETVLTATKKEEVVNQKKEKAENASKASMLSKISTVVIPSTIAAFTSAFSFMATTVVRVCAFAMSMVWTMVAGTISFLLANPAVAIAVGLIGVAYGGYKYFQYKTGKEDPNVPQLTVNQPTGARPSTATTTKPEQVSAKPLSTVTTDVPKSVKKAVVGGDVKSAIHKASQVVGVPVSLLTAMAGVESAFRTDAGASTSSAKGLFQFINSTWVGVLAKYGDKYGVPKDASRFDPTYSAIMAAAMMKHEGYPAAKAAVSNPSMTDIYLTHFLGPTGGRKFIFAYMANPDAYGTSAVNEAQANANYNIFFDKVTGNPRTLRQIYDMFAKKLGTWLAKGEDIVGAPSVVATAPQTNTQTQQQVALADAPLQGGASVNPSPDYVKRGKQILKVENGLSSA